MLPMTIVKQINNNSLSYRSKCCNVWLQIVLCDTLWPRNDFAWRKVVYATLQATNYLHLQNLVNPSVNFKVKGVKVNTKNKILHRNV